MWKALPRTKLKCRDPPTSRGSKRNCRQQMSVLILDFIFPLICIMVQGTHCAECPPSNSLAGCSCYNFQDGLFLECSGSTEESLKSALSGVLRDRKPEGHLESLSIYELDQRLQQLRSNIFPNGSRIRHLQISQSNIREISEDTFKKLKTSLEILAIVSSKLSDIPQQALAPLVRLSVLDLEANMIHDLSSYAFYSLSLIKLNLRNNKITKISEYAFAGLENSLKELDLTENKIKIFPMTALRRLEHLTSLKLAWNEISKLPEDGYSRLDRLNSLDLSSNNFKIITLNCFRCCPSLKTLSLYYNVIESVDKDAFISLKDLESIDLSHNKIIFLDIATFRANQKLRSIDLSQNHIHHIRGVFARLPELEELFLAENNILEIPANAFSGSSSLSALYLHQNAIRSLNPKGLATLDHLTQLHLSDNYIEKVPRDFLQHCGNLLILSLDGNNIKDLEVGTFSRANQLKELRLQDNQITEIKRDVFDPLPRLLELHLQNNAITDMETGALKSLHSLQHVNLQGNLLAVLGDVFQVSNIAGQNGNSGISLVSIQLDNNGLGVLHNDSLRGQTSVRIMWLGHNRLTRLQAPLFRDLILVERLYLTNNSISRIEDNAFLPMQALKLLDLSMNRLSHVTVRTFSELHELEELYLGDNGLRRIDSYALTALKRLRVLDLANNHLSVLHDNIFQEGLPIRILNLRNSSVNVIERGTFRGLNNLYELNMEYNHLFASAIDRLEIPGLRILKISHNNFSQLNADSIDGLPSLQHLAMDYCQIQRIPSNLFSNNKNLAKLYLSNNLLRTLPIFLFRALDSLKEVKLDGNRFQDIPYEVFSNSTKIELLSLAHNVILHVDMSKFDGLINLKELNLRDNYIISLSGFGSVHLSNLLSVDLSYNHLTALPVNFFIHSNYLRKVELAGNKFRQIPATALSGWNIPGLGWLNITANPLMRIHGISPEASYPVLQEIHICGTNLSVVNNQDFEAFSALLHLFINNNKISRIASSAFRSLPNLLTLDLSMNELESLPQDRFKGLVHLRLLNLTRNHLRELEDFSADLKALQVLDLSHNRISKIKKTIFEHLENLAELHLSDNHISIISSDAFCSLKKLVVLNLSRNLLENLPLSALRLLETQIKSLRTEGNPLHCGCETQELWEWLRDHLKLIGDGSGVDRNRGNIMGMNEVKIEQLKCEQPAELRGLVFLELDPQSFCSAPLVLEVAVEDIQPYSVLVSWEGRNHSGLYAYQVAYHAKNVQEVRGRMLAPNSRSVRLSKLLPDTRYSICVLGLGNWLPDGGESSIIAKFNESAEGILDASIVSQMVDSATGRCSQVTTLEEPVVADSDESSFSDTDNVNSFLTRRFGLIVGCCMGVVVFLSLVSAISYFKIKKRRENLKRNMQPVQPEYISYRHFSIQSGEAGHSNKTASANQDCQNTNNKLVNDIKNINHACNTTPSV